MQRFARYCLPAAAVLAMTLLTASVGQRLLHRAAARRALDNWDIPALTDHLNRAGLEVQLRSSRVDGLFGHYAFLTTTDKDWDDLNHLHKDPSRIQEWRGTVSCERVRKDFKPILDNPGDRYLVAGPFLFYGDAELLERIRAILVPSAPAPAP